MRRMTNLARAWRKTTQPIASRQSQFLMEFNWCTVRAGSQAPLQYDSLARNTSQVDVTLACFYWNNASPETQPLASLAFQHDNIASLEIPRSGSSWETVEIKPLKGNFCSLGLQRPAWDVTAAEAHWIGWCSSLSGAEYLAEMGIFG